MIVWPHDRHIFHDEVKVFVTGLSEHHDEIDEAVDFARQQAVFWIVDMAPHRVMPSGHIPRRTVQRWEREADLAAEVLVTMEASHG